MKVVDEFNYRNAFSIIESQSPKTLEEIRKVLLSNELHLETKGKQRDLSAQVQEWFEESGWELERPCFAITEMRYDLYKYGIPIEIELGHQRLVFPDFFKFLADYSKSFIPAAIMIVAGNSMEFGHNWHCSIDSTKRKIEAIKEVFLVPLLVIAINPK
jgi:hypothetical protein